MRPIHQFLATIALAALVTIGVRWVDQRFLTPRVGWVEQGQVNPNGTVSIWGWTWNLKDKAPVSAVALSDDNKVLGILGPNLERPEVVRTLGLPADARPGFVFEIAASQVTGGKMRVAAIMADGRAVQLMVAPGAANWVAAEPFPTRIDWIWIASLAGLATCGFSLAHALDRRSRPAMRTPRAAPAPAPRRSRAESFANAALLGASLTIGYLACEAAFRIYTYSETRANIEARLLGMMGVGGQNNYVPDPESGFRYRANLDITVDDPSIPFKARWSTNSHGHISRDDYTIAKPANEFRIAAVGDSFAAGVTNRERWPELLERHLAANAEWTALTGGRRTRVINFARDGIGVMAMERIVALEVPIFEPDMVIVSLVSDDFTRRIYTRGTNNFPDEASMRRFLAAYVDSMLRSERWWSLRPFLLETSVARVAGLPPVSIVDPGRSARTASQQEWRFPDLREGYLAGRGALMRVRSAYPEAMLLFHPSGDEYRNQPTRVDALTAWMWSDFRNLGMVDMTPRLRQTATLSAEEMYIPGDGHPSDAHHDVFARVLVGLLIETRKARR